MILPVLLLALAFGPDTGDIWVRFSPGAIVYLDGVKMSKTNLNENGALLHDVKIGAHKVTVEVPNGGSATLDVNVNSGELATVSISPLALHARPLPKGGIEVHAAADAKCVAAVNDKQQTISDPVTFDELRPGAYHVTVNCGTRGSAQGDVTVADGRVAILDTDLKSRKLNLLGDRSRVTKIAVFDPSKVVVNAPISPELKRALSAGLTDGATISSIKVPAGGVALVTVNCPNEVAANTFFSRVLAYGGPVRNVVIVSDKLNDDDSVTLVVAIYYV